MSSFSGLNIGLSSLLSLSGPEAKTYAPDGQSVQSARGPRLLNEAI